jgi:hypothetical protein
MKPAPLRKAAPCMNRSEIDRETVERGCDMLPRMSLGGTMRVLWRFVMGGTLLVLTVGCGSSEPPPPVDPLARDYCAVCSAFPGCVNVVTDALNAACPDETRSYYQCVTDNECDVAACQSEWTTRQACMESPS